ncbi:MAG: hypothetical protein HY961_06955 [Ignavibacteriae bacterium]|nr:hypothetical protein [Ignavibacteriota bacterium]
MFDRFSSAGCGLLRCSDALFAIISLVFAGCASQSVYLQQISVDGPQVQAPLFITNANKPGEIRIAPRIGINLGQVLAGRALGHSKVNADGIYKVDTVIANGARSYFEPDGANTKPFEGNNFSWLPTKVNVSLAVDYVWVKNISFVGGLSYGASASESYWGGEAGVGFFFESRNFGVRIDLGAHISTNSYAVDYVVMDPPFTFETRRKQVAFYHDEGKETDVTSYAAFTANTKIPSWPVQLFTQATINRQTLVHLKQKASFSDESTVLSSVSYFIVTPGLYFDFSSRSRMLLGVHLRDETELLGAHPGVLVTPFVQLEVGL